MIPVGYMAKRISRRPDWLQAEQVVDVYSVSGCVSKNFADFINYWRHNGYWFFNSPQVIQQLAQENALDLSGTQLFYYAVYAQEFDADLLQWSGFEPELSFTTQVAAPLAKILEGFDVVSFALGTSPECSPLSCNGLAAEVATNQHCLLESLEQARHLLDSGQHQQMEPGPYRIFAVYSVDWP